MLSCPVWHGSPRDEQARRDGYRDDYDRRRSQETAALTERLRAVRSRVSAADIETILQAKREGLL